MGDFLLAIYLWTKALHLIAAISWMVGLLYLPRLFVYHAERGDPGTDLSETLKIMERRLLKFIMTPAMVLTWIFGAALVLTPGVVDVGTTIWFQIKFLAVLSMTFFHFWLAARRKDFLNDTNARTSRTYRLMNEVPTVLMIAIIIMVVVRPFS